MGQSNPFTCCILNHYLCVSDMEDPGSKNPARNKALALQEFSVFAQDTKQPRSVESAGSVGLVWSVESVVFLTRHIFLVTPHRWVLMPSTKFQQHSVVFHIGCCCLAQFQSLDLKSNWMSPSCESDDP